ncbi:MAG: hypothetical protein U0401_01160 [Anaerolineae bacterium]
MLAEITRADSKAARYADLYRAWEKQRPYGLAADAGADEVYPAYRCRKFDDFLSEATAALPANRAMNGSSAGSRPVGRCAYLSKADVNPGLSYPGPVWARRATPSSWRKRRSA